MVAKSDLTRITWGGRKGGREGKGGAMEEGREEGREGGGGRKRELSKPLLISSQIPHTPQTSGTETKMGHCPNNCYRNTIAHTCE